MPPNVVIPVVPANLNLTEPELANLVQDVNTDDIINFLKDNKSQIYYNIPETVIFFTQFTNLRPETGEDIINQHNYTPLIQRGTAVINNLIRVAQDMTQKYKVAPRKSTREDNNAPPPQGPPVELKEKRKFSEVNEDKDVGGTMKRQGKRRKGTKKRRKNTKKRRSSNKRK